MRDQNLAFEMFKKGDLDYYFVNISRRVGRGAELRPGAARPDPEAEDLQRQPERHRRASRSTRARRRSTTSASARRWRCCSTAPSSSTKLFFNEYVPLNSFYRRQHLREPEQPEEPLRPAAALQAARRGGLEGPRRQGRLDEERPAAARSSCSTQTRARSAGSPSTRTTCARSASASTSAGTPETLFKLVDGAEVRHGAARPGRAALPESRDVVSPRRWPTCRTTTTSPASRTRAWTSC